MGGRASRWRIDRWSERRPSECMKCSPDAGLLQRTHLSLWSTYLSICLSNYLSFQLSIYAPIEILLRFLSINLCFLSIHISFHLCIYLSLCLYLYFFSSIIFIRVCPSVPLKLCVYPSLCLSLSPVYLPLYLSACPSFYPSIYPSILSIASILSSCLSACLSAYRVSLSDHNMYALSLHIYVACASWTTYRHLTMPWSQSSNQANHSRRPPFHQALHIYLNSDHPGLALSIIWGNIYHLLSI